jgi:multidrug efflux system membrane fusion protein
VRRRERVAVSVAALAAATSIGGVIGATFIKSPAQVAAEAGPPKAAVLLARVRRLEIRRTTTFRGQFETPGAIDFTPTSVVAPSGSGPGSSKLIVTRVLSRPGSAVRAGQVVAQVSGRPVFVLQGGFPAFRDMVQGETGPDITELQEALADLGYHSYPDPTGVFGPYTAAAVRGLYQSIGYATPVVGVVATKKKVVPVEVPASEVMFVPSFPATLVSGPGTLGEMVTTPLVKVSTGGLTLTAHLNAAASAHVHRGTRVSVVSSITGKREIGIVAAVGAVKVDAASASAYVPLTVEPRNHRWSASWTGQNVQLRITTRETDGPVLAVPESALASGHGIALVRARLRNGRVRDIAVRVGASAAGEVEVVPQGGARLDVGEQVEIG